MTISKPPKPLIRKPAAPLARRRQVCDLLPDEERYDHFNAAGHGGE
jgi:hypothetical protein